MDELSASARWARVWSVSALVQAVAALLEQGFPACTVSGEISSFSRAASGHCYFTLKDAGRRRSAALRDVPACASLLDFAPADGQRVELRGRLGVYEPRGELQFVAEAMQSRRRRRPVRALPAPARAARSRRACSIRRCKRPLPAHPARDRRRHLARPRAALHDVATTLARRVAARPGRRLSEPRPGHRRAGGAVRGDRRSPDERARSRRPRRLPRRRLARGSVGLQRRARRARRARGADAGRVRRRPRDRRDPRRPRRRPARADADRGRRARRRRATAAQASRAAGLARGAAPTAQRATLETAAQRLDRLALRLARPAEAARRRRHTCSRCSSSASRARRRAPWPPADRARDAGAAPAPRRSRSRGRASPRASTPRRVRLRGGRSAAGAGARLRATRRTATAGRSPRSRGWRSARPSARARPTARAELTTTGVEPARAPPRDQHLRCMIGKLPTIVEQPTALKRISMEHTLAPAPVRRWTRSRRT